MGTKKGRLAFLAAIFSLVLAGANAHSQTLTGITVFSADLNGNIVTTAVFNTFGGDLVPNIYVIDNPVTSTYLNSGDTGGTSAPTGISIPLALGGREFFASVDPTGSVQGTFYGLNLFFNGNNTTPGISAFTALNTPAGTANSGSTLANSGGLTLVPGANTLIFNDPSGYVVTLSLFNYATSRVAGLPTDFPEDLVGPFALGANGTPDNYVDFTLTVVPEPSTWALIATGVGALGLLVRQERPEARHSSNLLS
jgi:hypothetical protein